MHDKKIRPAPGTVIGYLKSGRPVRVQAGGSETATETPPAPPAAQPPPAAPAAPAAADPPAAPRVPAGQPEGGQFAPPQPPAPAAPVPAPPPAPPETDWKAEAERLRTQHAEAVEALQRAKAETRKQENRSKANYQQVRGLEGVVRQIAEKLEIEYDDKPDPEEVSRRLSAATAEARQLRVERAIYLTAAKAGADANALLDSREFITRTEQIDPESSDFADQVAELVRAAAADARYKVPQPPAPEPAAPAVQQQAQPAPPPAQPPAPSSGADFSGAPGGNRLWTQADYDHWTKPGMDRDGKIMADAIEKGLLVNLGIGKPRRPTRR